MPDAHAALRAAIHAVLAADPALMTRLGGPRVYDEPPTGTEPPFLAIADARVNDWADGGEGALEHLLTLRAWSRQGGHLEATRIAGDARAALHDADLPLDGHRLVNLRATSMDVRRTPDGRNHIAHLRLRAVTEPNS